MPRFDGHASQASFGVVWRSSSQPTVDGVVKLGEYDHSTVLGDGLYALSWTFVGDMA